MKNVYILNINGWWLGSLGRVEADGGDLEMSIMVKQNMHTPYYNFSVDIYVY